MRSCASTLHVSVMLNEVVVIGYGGDENNAQSGREMKSGCIL